MSNPADCAGIVLAGGKSSRMGKPKAWLPFAGQTMLERAVTTLAQVCTPIVVVGAPDQDLPELRGDVSIARDEQEGRGPLQGLAAGLKALVGGSVPVAYLSSCDVPLLRAEFVRAVIGQLGDADIAVPKEDRFHHPMAAVYRLETVLPVVEELLAADRLRPFFLFEQLRTIEIPVADLRTADPNLDSLRNCNTPEDYEELRCLLRDRREE